MPLEPGSRLGSYQIVDTLGAGGMGEVYLARHLKLGRDVAIKVLPSAVADDARRRARFEREARTASALSHPNIVTIHDIAEHEGTTYLVMERVEGRTVRELLADGPLSVDRGLDIAGQIAEGLAKAHEAGVVHRDLKPANVMVTDDGLVKILDFGLARPLATAAGRELDLATLTRETDLDTILGTPHYMSPEQLSGEELDGRSDQFAFGVVMYEVLGGRPPFEGSSLPAVIGAILTKPAPALEDVRAETPADLGRIVARCLAKDPADRFPSMRGVGDDLKRLAEARALADRSVTAQLRRPAVAVPLVAAVLGLAGWGVLWSLGAEERWAEEEALPEITTLIETGDLYGAYRTALRAQEQLPDDPELARVFERMTLPVRIDTRPTGARVSVREYAVSDASWMDLGTTPLELRVPYQLMHWRIERKGYEPFDGAPFGGGSFRRLAQGLVLDSLGERPEGTVRIPGGPLAPIRSMDRARPLEGAAVEPYHLERYEVTNREFKAFVDAGGYQSPAWWPTPMMRHGREIPWEDAMDDLRDLTGRHGPSTWELGDHPVGEAEHPVGGISWHEAWAYCAWRGRSLPTVFHWFQAIGQGQRSEILVHSNMEGGAKAPVGAFRGMSGYGAYDMAGNVKEWAWNGYGGMRYALGGAWNEAPYLFRRLLGADPWARDANHGVRCAEYPDPPSEALTADVAPVREFDVPEPVSDETFEVLRGMYDYDRAPLEARVERVDTLSSYVRETVSVRTAYGDERMDVNLLLPHDAAPPYQSVVWYPGDDVFALSSSESFSSEWLFDFLPRSGRAIVYPVYRGMYERAEDWQRTPNNWRDMTISWAQDIGRAIDYLETRDDFDTTRIGFYGFSAGSMYAPIFMSVEERIRTAVVIGGGVIPGGVHPAMHPAHFAPRTEKPVLMINGRNDFLAPYEEAQQPYLELFGAPDSLKRLARLPGGHIPTDTRDIIREVLDWLDRTLGPVGAGS